MVRVSSSSDSRTRTGFLFGALGAGSMATLVFVVPQYGAGAAALIVVFGLACLVIAGGALIGNSISLSDNIVLVRAPFKRPRRFPLASVDRLVCVQVQGTGYVALIGRDDIVLATVGNSFAGEDLENFALSIGLPLTYTEQSMLGHVLTGARSRGARVRRATEQNFSGSMIDGRKGRKSAALVLAFLATVAFVIAAIFGHR